MTDFENVKTMLTKAGVKFKIDPIEGEHPSILIPSRYPKAYSTGVCYSFNDDGSLYAVHSYEPEEDEN